MSKSAYLDALSKMKRAHPEVTVRRLAAAAGVSRQAADKWFKTGQVTEENLKIIADLFDADFEELRLHRRYVPLGRRNTRTIPATAHDVPLLDWQSVDYWLTSVSEPKPKEASSMVSTTRKTSRDAFALEMRDDSMQSPTGESYPIGAVLIVDPKKKAVSGSKVIVRFQNGSSPTFKQLIYDAGKRFLKPLNPRYPVMEMPADAQILGVVVQMQLDVDD